MTQDNSGCENALFNGSDKIAIQKSLTWKVRIWRIPLEVWCFLFEAVHSSLFKMCAAITL